MSEELLAFWNSPNTQRIIAIVIGLALILIIRFFINRALQKRVKDPKTKYKAGKATSFFAYLFIVFLLLFVFRDKVGDVGVALGVAGAGIAFALQEVIVSFAGWLNILVSGVVNVGDRVKIGDVKGDVIDIGIISSTIMEVGDWIDGDMYNGRIVTVANSFIFKNPVHNYSSEYPFLWDEITVPIRTESDYKLAREIFTTAIEDICGDYAIASEKKWQGLTSHYRVEAAKVKPMVSLTFNQNWITFTLRYVVDYKKRRSTKDQIFTRLLDEISRHDNITIATTAVEVTNKNESKV